jgi:hypothetical protein
LVGELGGIGHLDKSAKFRVSATTVARLRWFNSVNYVRAILGTLVLATNVACVPVLIQQQPSIAFEVHGDDGQALPGAKLHFARIPICFACMNHTSWLDNIPADNEGRVSVHRFRELQLALMVPDAGPVTYVWAWCIDHEGYAPSIQNRFGANDVKAAVSVTLKASTSGTKCIWRDNREFVSAAL